MLVWTKLASAKWEDAWIERLRFVAARLAVFQLAGGRAIRLDVFDVSASEGEELIRHFGGKLRRQKAAPPRGIAAHRAKPLVIRDRLAIVQSAREKTRVEANGKRRAFIIPAGMAFGTGDHFTTATCLRLLCDAAREFGSQPWDMLDLGTGSGILALAARALGASRVEAADFDPACVRIAKENAALNCTDRVRVVRRDVLKWKPSRAWEVVTANLYSSILVAAADAIAEAVKPGGVLIFSGIIREQESECIAAFARRGFTMGKIARRGKWVAALARKTGD